MGRKESPVAAVVFTVDEPTAKGESHEPLGLPLHRGWEYIHMCSGVPSYPLLGLEISWSSLQDRVQCQRGLHYACSPSSDKQSPRRRLMSNGAHIAYVPFVSRRPLQRYLDDTLNMAARAERWRGEAMDARSLSWLRWLVRGEIEHGGK